MGVLEKVNCILIYCFKGWVLDKISAQRDYKRNKELSTFKETNDMRDVLVDRSATQWKVSDTCNSEHNHYFQEHAKIEPLSIVHGLKNIA